MSPATYRACIYLRDRHPQVYIHPAVFVLGFAAMAAGLLLGLTGWVDQTRVAEETPAAVTYLWLFLTVIGGGLITRSLWIGSPRGEYLGLVFVGVALVAQVISVVTTTGVGGAYGAVMQAGIAVAFFVRAGILSTQERVARVGIRRREGRDGGAGDDRSQ